MEGESGCARRRRRGPGRRQSRRSGFWPGACLEELKGCVDLGFDLQQQQSSKVDAGGFVELDKALFRKISATTKGLRSQLWICSARRASRRLLRRNSDAAIWQGGDEDSRRQPHPALLQIREHAPLHEDDLAVQPGAARGHAQPVLHHRQAYLHGGVHRDGTLRYVQKF